MRARTRTCPFCGFRIAAGTRHRALGRATEQGDLRLRRRCLIDRLRDQVHEVDFVCSAMRVAQFLLFSPCLRAQCTSRFCWQSHGSWLSASGLTDEQGVRYGRTCRPALLQLWSRPSAVRQVGSAQGDARQRAIGGTPLEPRNSESGRGDWIRTSDPLRPRQVRYQAALRPDSNSLGF